MKRQQQNIWDLQLLVAYPCVKFPHASACTAVSRAFLSSPSAHTWHTVSISITTPQPIYPWPHHFYSLSQHLGWDQKRTTREQKPAWQCRTFTGATQEIPKLHEDSLFRAPSLWLGGCTPGYVLPHLSFYFLVARCHIAGANRGNTLPLSGWHTCWPGTMEGKPTILPYASGKPAAETSLCPVNSSSLYMSTWLEEASPDSRLLWGLSDTEGKDCEQHTSCGTCTFQTRVCHCHTGF